DVAVADQRDEEHADDRSPNRAGTAEDARSAHHDSGEDGERKARVARRCLSTEDAGGVDDPGEAGRAAAEHEREDADAVDADAREPRGLRVAAGRVHVAAR